MKRRILLIGLDAADREVIATLCGQGRLPNLQRLFAAGLSGPLESPAPLYAGGVWPTFYTGRSVPWHGVFHNKLWRPETMRVEVPGDDWLPARPFWEALSDAGIRSCIVDVPMVLGRPRPIDGTILSGWGTHDLICKGSWPGDLWPRLERRFGAPRMPREHFGRQTAHSLRRLTGDLADATAQLGDIAVDLLGDGAWQLACVVFGAIHRAGHYLYDLSQLEGAADTDSLQTALHDVYTRVDGALGRVVDGLPPDTLVIAFSAHGMGPNPGWSDLLPDILAKLEEHASGTGPKHGRLYALKQRLPYHWVRPVLRRLPGAVTDRLVTIWSRGMFDWSQTRSFPMPMDEAGYLRINLRGREASGIVEAGAEYEALCRDIEARVGGLFDESTGDPIAGDIVRAWQDADPAAPCRRLVPDLVVPWRGPPAIRTRRLRSATLPGFVYDVPSRLPSGRSGNHTDRAWFAASGPGVRPGRLGDPGRTPALTDLLPTVFRYLGVPVPPQVPGQALELGEIAGKPVP